MFDKLQESVIAPLENAHLGIRLRWYPPELFAHHLCCDCISETGSLDFDSAE
jgi:hypothetical protein